MVRLKIARSVSPVVGGSSSLSTVLLSLAEVLGLCPVRTWFRGQLEIGQSVTQNLGSPSQALFFLLIVCGFSGLSVFWTESLGFNF